MALAPADFYAFSRATGIPVPETPEEQAQLAPQVLDFRRNQLRAPKEESNPLAAVGAAALGLGALAGLGFGARRFLARNADIPKGPAKSATAGVRQVNLSDFEAPVRRAAEMEAPAPSRPAPVPTVVEEEFQAFRPDPKEFVSRDVAEARRRAASEALAKAAAERRSPYQMEIPGTKATLSAIRSKEIPEALFDPSLGLVPVEGPSRPLSAAPDQFALDLTSLQQQSLPQTQAQSFNAVESGIGQSVQKVNATLQRNEDVDVISAQSFLQQKREELAGRGLNRSQIENVLANDPNIKEGVELFAATGDPGALSRLSDQPASPIALRATEQAGAPGIPAETVGTGQFFKQLPFGENVDYLVDQDINLTNTISALSEKQQQLPSIKSQLEEQANMAQFAIRQGGPASDEAMRVFANTQFQLQNLPDYRADISEAFNQRDYVRQQITSLESLGPKQKLIDVGEGFNVSAETGELIPARASVPGGTVSKPAAGSSIRGMSGAIEMENFIPEERAQAATAAAEMAMGPRMGIEPARREAMLRRPVMFDPNVYPAKTKTPEGFVYSEESLRRPSQVVGRQANLGPVKTASPEVRRQSVDVSEQLRRLQSSSKPGALQEAQELLQRLQQGLL
jgi:hypothetical protein